VAPKNIEPAKQALSERGLEINDKTTFLVLSSMVPGKKLELNEGIRLLTGKSKIDIPLKKKEVAPQPEVSAPAPTASPIITGPTVSKCTIKENGRSRTFEVTIEPIGQADSAQPVTKPGAAKGQGTGVFSAFAGTVQVVDIMAKNGDQVSKGDVVAAVEAMKATHDIKAPCSGTVSEICTQIGQEIDSKQPILIIS